MKSATIGSVCVAGYLHPAMVHASSQKHSGVAADSGEEEEDSEAEPASLRCGIRG